MARTIVAAELFEELKVDLWGHVFEVREGTLDVDAKLKQLYERLEKVPDDEETSSAALAEVYADLLDVLLKPLPTDGQKATRAKTTILRKFKANEIGLDRIVAVTQQIQAAAEERGRPTSPETRDGGST